ncbi:hypothetical protein AMECASPLE_017440, partial [Ameca splendens]
GQTGNFLFSILGINTCELCITDPSCADENKEITSFYQDTHQQRDGTHNAAIRSDISSDHSQDHKYVVQAKIHCGNWNLDESQLAFVHMLQEMNKNEMRVFKHEDLKSSSTISTSSHNGNKPDTQKTSRKGEGDKQKGKPAAFPKSGPKQDTRLDLTKPNWTLRVVTDQTKLECLEVKKDTERADQIRSIKKAWETAEPGRSEKAFQSCFRFLKQVLHKESNDATSDESEDIASSSSDRDTYVSPSDVKMTVASSLCRIDNSHLIRHQKDSPEPMDSDREEARQKDHFEKIQNYRLARENLLERYKQKMLEKYELKKHHLEVYENMLVASEKLSDDCKQFCSSLMALTKKEPEEKPALKEAEQAVLKKRLTPTGVNPSKKHAKRGEKE